MCQSEERGHATTPLTVLEEGMRAAIDLRKIRTISREVKAGNSLPGRTNVCKIAKVVKVSLFAVVTAGSGI